MGRCVLIDESESHVYVYIVGTLYSNQTLKKPKLGHRAHPVNQNRLDGSTGAVSEVNQIDSVGFWLPVQDSKGTAYHVDQN